MSNRLKMRCNPGKNSIISANALSSPEISHVHILENSQRIIKARGILRSVITVHNSLLCLRDVRIVASAALLYLQNWAAN